AIDRRGEDLVEEYRRLVAPMLDGENAAIRQDGNADAGAILDVTQSEPRFARRRPNGLQLRAVMGRSGTQKRSSHGRNSISHVQALRDCVRTWKYASAMASGSSVLSTGSTWPRGRIAPSITK